MLGIAVANSNKMQREAEARIMSFVRIACLAATCAVVFVESAYAGITAIPGPIAGAGIPGLIAAGVAAYAWYRRRK